MTHMLGPADAVEPHSVDAGAFIRPGCQGLQAFPGPGDAVRVHREGKQDQRLRAFFLDPRRRLRDARQGWQRFKQEILNALGKEEIGEGGIACKSPFFLRGGADIRKDEGFLPGGPESQLRPGLHQRGLIRFIPGGLTDMGGEGVGLDGPASRPDIGPMDGEHRFRRGEAGPFHRPGGIPRHRAGIGAHGPVEEQGAGR